MDPRETSYIFQVIYIVMDWYIYIYTASYIVMYIIIMDDVQCTCLYICMRNNDIISLILVFIGRLPPPPLKSIHY